MRRSQCLSSRAQMLRNQQCCCRPRCASSVLLPCHRNNDPCIVCSCRCCGGQPACAVLAQEEALIRCATPLLFICGEKNARSRPLALVAACTSGRFAAPDIRLVVMPVRYAYLSMSTKHIPSASCSDRPDVTQSCCSSMPASYP